MALVDAPDGIVAEIETAETALLAHVGRSAPGGAALVKISAGNVVVEESRPHARARIGAPDHGAHGPGGDVITRYSAGKIQAAGAAARHAPANHAAKVAWVNVVDPDHANGAGRIGVADGAAIASDQAADTGPAIDAAGSVRLRDGAVVIADQAAHLFTRRGDRARGARHRDGTAAAIAPYQAAHGRIARVIRSIEPRHGASGGGIADRAAIEAHQAADIGVAADGHAAGDVADRAATIVARHRTHIITADNAAAHHRQVADGAPLQPCKQAAAEIR